MADNNKQRKKQISKCIADMILATMVLGFIWWIMLSENGMSLYEQWALILIKFIAIVVFLVSLIDMLTLIFQQTKRGNYDR